MAHEIAKQLLEHAVTFPQRTEAVRKAISLDMSLNEIEAYLDWLDFNHSCSRPAAPDNDLPPADSGQASSSSPK